MLTRVDLLLLSLLTLFWGINWPVMKYAVLDYPPLMFRTWSMGIGIVCLGLYMLVRGEQFAVVRSERHRVIHLALGNMLIWHLFAIYAIKALTSGRAAIVGYTMPVWALLASVFFFKGKFTWRGGIGVALALSATMLLAAEEFSSLIGKPVGLALMLIAAMGWGLGTAMMNYFKLTVSNASLTFWMMCITASFLFFGAFLIERDQWRWPNPGEWAAIWFNAIVVFGFCHVVWFRIARKLPPVASSLSIMLIPVLGVFSGAWALNEKVGVYDLGALVLILLSMGVVLFPKRQAKPAVPAE
ncbi:DMT family transporter [beta proteobacterium MWH-UniP1]